MEDEARRLAWAVKEAWKDLCCYFWGKKYFAESAALLCGIENHFFSFGSADIVLIVGHDPG